MLIWCKRAMETSVEIIHTKINQKIDILRSTINDMREELKTVLEKMSERFKNKKASIERKMPMLEKYLNKIDKLEDDYSVNVVILLDDSDDERIYRDEVISSGIIGSLDYIRHQLLDFTKYIPKLSNDVMQRLVNYKNLRVTIKNKTAKEYDLCEKCNCKMSVKAEESCLECDKCGMILPMPGAVLDKTVCFSQEGQRVRQGTYDHVRHIIKWMNNIQAKNRNKIPDKVVESVRKCAIRDYTKVDFKGKPYLRNMKGMKCKQIRTWLQETGYTKYNDYSPQIREMITGVIPYQLTYEENQIIVARLRLIVDVFNDIKTEYGYHNMRYYPYWIFKAIEMSFPRNSGPWLLLECIHLQSEDTVEENDKILKIICEKTPELPSFRKTDRNILCELFL